MTIAMVEFWGSFAATGEPRADGQIAWPRFGVSEAIECRGDTDCGQKSYCMNDPSKTPPYFCHNSVKLRQTTLQFDLPIGVMSSSKYGDCKFWQGVNASNYSLKREIGAYR